MKKAITTLTGVLFVSILACGCSSEHEKLYGAWKSEEINSSTGKPNIVIIQSDQANINGEEGKIYIEKLD